VDKDVNDVRRLLSELSDRLSPHWVETADELLEAAEPNEALLQIAWGITSEGIQVPERIVSFIEQTAGRRQDLPPDLRRWQEAP
jgi:hypothetical protein